MKYLHFHVVAVHPRLTSGIAVRCGKVLDGGLFSPIRDLEVIRDVIVELSTHSSHLCQDIANLLCFILILKRYIRLLNVRKQGANTLLLSSLKLILGEN